MKDERIREIIAEARKDLRKTWDECFEDAIRLALAERDREVAEWVKAHRQETGEGGDVVDHDALVDFLEAQP